MQRDDVSKQSSEKTPINADKYAFDKFPEMRSPKFSENEVVEVINLKKKMLIDKHEKLGELVNALHREHLVSPRTYNLHMNSLQKKFD